MCAGNLEDGAPEKLNHAKLVPSRVVLSDHRLSARAALAAQYHNRLNKRKYYTVHLLHFWLWKAKWAAAISPEGWVDLPCAVGNH
jgi:hypothetical protein